MSEGIGHDGAHREIGHGTPPVIRTADVPDHDNDDHGQLRANDERWLALPLVGIQRSDTTTSADIELRHCTCGSTIGRRVKEETMRFETYRDPAGSFRWRLLATNGKIITASGEGYERRDLAQRAVATLQTAVLTARIIDV
jgi:uncharacterized protein YegP (UPF0339 family)